MKKFLLWSGGILLLLILGGSYLFFFYPDEELKSFKELELDLPNISEEENGYKYMIQAYEAFKVSEDGYRDLIEQIYDENKKLMDIESMPDFYPFLKLNTETLVLIDKANEFDYIIPEFDLKNTDLNYLLERTSVHENYMSVNRLLLYRVLYTLKQGDQDRAIEGVVDLIDFHNKKLLFPNSLIGYVMDLAHMQSVLDVLNLALNSGDLGKADYQKLLNFLNNFKPNFIVGWDNALKVEFNTDINFINSLIKLSPDHDFLGKSKFHFQVNKTKNAFLDRFTKMMNNPFYSFVEEDSLALENGISLLFSQNSVGKAMMYSFLPSLSGCKPFIMNFNFNSLRLLIAIKLYELENGEVPDRLEDLVPVYFENLEWLDFKGERTIDYKPTGILYSDFLVKNCKEDKVVNLLK